MSALRTLCRHLSPACRDERGTAVIEMAFVMPILIALGLGAVEISSIVARQNELQNAADVAASAAIAAQPDTPGELAPLKGVLQATTGLPASGVAVTLAYRCGTATSYVTDAAACGSADHSTYVRIILNDRYTPAWTGGNFGPVAQLSVMRQAIVGQSR